MPSAARWQGHAGHSAWLALFRRYLIWTAGANLAWEMAHLPLYTVWETETAWTVARLVVLCTAGDTLLGLNSLIFALILLNPGNWPARSYWQVTGVAVVIGLSFTLLMEWYSTKVAGLWAYSDLMPTLPSIGAGLSPLAQWIVVPFLGLWWARRGISGSVTDSDRVI